MSIDEDDYSTPYRVDLTRESEASYIYCEINERKGETEANYAIRRLSDGIGELCRVSDATWTEDARCQLSTRALAAEIVVEEAVWDDEGCPLACWTATAKQGQVSVGLSEVDCVLRALDPSLKLPKYLSNARPKTG